jgi:hypothetical protein
VPFPNPFDRARTHSRKANSAHIHYSDTSPK